MLEVIDKGSSGEAHPAPLLFVHGANHAAWCWDEHFLDFFADKGYRALAVNLRGHGGSATSKPLRKCSIADYVDDVASVADTLQARPVVIGHSMGGFVVQKYLESHEAPAGVLVASFPPGGSAGMTLRRMKRHPWLSIKAAITGKQLPGLNTPKLAREAFFCSLAVRVVGGRDWDPRPRQRGDAGQQLGLIGLDDHQVVRFQGAADQLRGRGLGVHRVHRDQQPHLPEGVENLSHTGDFVALLGDGELAEH